MKVRLFLCCLCSVFSAMWAGSITVGQTPTIPETIIETQSEIDLIHLGDLIEVDIVGSLEFDWRGTLSPEGYLSGPTALADRVFGLCRSEIEIAADVARGLGKILRSPVVKVRILDRSNRPHASLYGAVRSPRRFQIKRAIRINELIVLGGGFTENASGMIQVFRPATLNCARRSADMQKPSADGGTRDRFISVRQDNGSQFFNIRIADLLGGKPESNIEILAGDIVTVVESKPIYVIGGVVTPRQIPTREQITVTRVISGAGGLTKNADPADVTIYRRGPGGSKVLTCDLTKIKAGLAEDLVLQGFDIVEIGQRGGSKRKFPPVVNTDDAAEASVDSLPLSIVD